MPSEELHWAIDAQCLRNYAFIYAARLSAAVCSEKRAFLRARTAAESFAAAYKSLLTVNFAVDMHTVWRAVMYAPPNAGTVRCARRAACRRVLGRRNIE